MKFESVVVRCWPSSRSRHVFGHLEDSLLCQRTQHLQALHETKKKASGTWAQEESLNSHPEPTSDQTSLARIHYSTGAQDSPGRQHKYKDHFLSVWRPFPKSPKTPTRKPSGARYSCTTYNWLARSSRFTDPATLSDHPHVLNVVTPLYQCVLL